MSLLDKLGQKMKRSREGKSSTSSSESDTPSKKKVIQDTTLDITDSDTDTNQLTSIPEDGKGFDLISEIRALRNGQDRLELLFRSEMASIKQELHNDIDKRMNKITTSVQSQINKLDGQLKHLEQKLSQLSLVQDKVAALETQAQAGYNQVVNSKTADDIECTVVCQNVHQLPGEDVLQVAGDIIEALSVDDITICSAKRMPVYKPGHNGLLKITLATVEQKITVLKAKQRLRNHPQYRHVYI